VNKRVIPHTEKAKPSSDAPAPVQTERNLKGQHPMKVTKLDPIQTKRGVVGRIQLDPAVDPPVVLGRKQPSEGQVKSLITFWSAYSDKRISEESAKALLESYSVKNIEDAIRLFHNDWRTRSTSLACRIDQTINYCQNTKEVL
jgi:hypothetical protein